MNQWIIEHWQSLAGWISTTGVAVWAWFSAHNGKIRSCIAWIVKQRNLNTENANLTKQIAATDKLLHQESARSSELEAERDVLSECLEPPLQPAEIEIIQFLAKRGTPIECYRFVGCFSLDRTRFEYHMNRLTRQFYLITSHEFADTRPPVYDLTESGRAYAVLNNLC